MIVLDTCNIVIVEMFLPIFSSMFNYMLILVFN
nr:MAG TPA: hypothetical protein [Bacteriophage sp.]